MTSEEAPGPAVGLPQPEQGEAGPSTQHDHNGASHETQHKPDTVMTDAVVEENGQEGVATAANPVKEEEGNAAATTSDYPTAQPSTSQLPPMHTTLRTRVPGTAIAITQQVAPIPPYPIPPKDCSFEERKRHRDRIRQLPFGKFFECTGRPTMVWEVADYTEAGAGLARSEIPFLFKAFETGQIGPARMKAKYGDARAHTIHEYLDWTMIAQPPTPENDLVWGVGGALCLQVIDYVCASPPSPTHNHLPSPPTHQQHSQTNQYRTLQGFVLLWYCHGIVPNGPHRDWLRSQYPGNTPTSVHH